LEDCTSAQVQQFAAKGPREKRRGMYGYLIEYRRERIGRGERESNKKMYETKDICPELSQD
jgi:hypothetical protein